MLLIDGDILLYKAGFAVQTQSYTVHFKDLCSVSGIKTAREAKALMTPDSRIERVIEAEPITHACHLFRNLVSRICKACRVEYSDFRIVLSGEENFRYGIARTQPYKGNRSSGDKPLHFDALKAYVLDYYRDNTEVAHGEADDYLGVYATTHPDTIIATIDKDLMMIPGLNFHFDKNYLQTIEDPGDLWIEVTESSKKTLRGYGFKWFCAQMLLGDIADHIPGIRGLGQVKTLTELDKCTTIRSMYAKVIRIYRKHKAIDRLDEIRQLLWIHRKESFEEIIKK